MRKTDLAYTAGIIDGEGSIQIHKYPRKKHKRRYVLSLLVRVKNTNQWLCNWLKFAFGGSVYLSSTPAGKPIWEWSLETKQAGEFLKLVLPYLRIKRPEAELALQFQARKTRRGRGGIPDKEATVEEAERILLQQMHKRPENI